MSPRRATAAAAILLAALLLASAVASGLASASSSRDRPPEIVHPRYRIVGHAGETTNGPYTILWRPGEGPVIGTLVDERTGRHRLLRLPGFCLHPGGVGPILGGPYVLADCGRRSLALDVLTAERWHRLAVRGPCRGRTPSDCPADAVGSDWVEYDSGTPHTGDVFVFQNIATGHVRRDPQTRHVVADLDSPELARRVCSPLQVPRDGALLFQGHFALALDEGTTYLEECGARLRVALGGPGSSPAIGPGAVIDEAGPKGPIRGIALPSLRRFTIARPRGADFLMGVDLSLGHLYVDATTRTHRYDVFSAPVSALPPVAR